MKKMSMRQLSGWLLVSGLGTCFFSPGCSSTEYLPFEVSVTINRPTSADRFLSPSNVLVLEGTATATAGILKVTWQLNDDAEQNASIECGFSTECIWATGAVTLPPGENRITVTAYDKDFRKQRKVLVVADDFSRRFSQAATVVRTFKALYSGVEYSLLWYGLPAEDPPGRFALGRSSDSPALAWNPLAQKLYVAVKGAANNNIYTARFSASGSFEYRWTQITGTTPSAPAMVWNPRLGKMFIAVRGQDNDLYVASLSEEATIQGDWTHLSSGKTLSAPALAFDEVDEKIVLAVRGQDDRIYVSTFTSFDGTFENNWLPLGGVENCNPTCVISDITTKTAPAILWNPLAKKLHLVVTAADYGKVMAVTFTLSDLNKDSLPWIDLGDLPTSSAPTLVWNGATDEADLMVNATDHTLWWASFGSDGTYKNNWNKFPSSSAAAPGLAWLPSLQKLQMIIVAPPSLPAAGGVLLGAKVSLNGGGENNFDEGFSHACYQMGGGGPGCQGLARIISDAAAIHAFLYVLDGDSVDADKAVFLVKSLVNNYDTWKSSQGEGVWILNALAAAQLALAAWLLWDIMDVPIQNLVRQVILSEAEYYSYRVEPVFGVRGTNTPAEDNGSPPTLLAMAAALFPSAEEDEIRLSKLACFAYHTVTVGTDFPFCEKRTLSALDNGAGLALYRASEGRFLIDYDADLNWSTSDMLQPVPAPGSLEPQPVHNDQDLSGWPNGLPVAGDWNGDGLSEIGVYVPTESRFYLDADGNGVWQPPTDRTSGKFGGLDEVPIVGDWNGDGRDDIGVFGPSGNGGDDMVFYLDTDGDMKYGQGDFHVVFGNAGDLPLAGKWTPTGKDLLGVFRPSNSTFYLDRDGDCTWTEADISFIFAPNIDTIQSRVLVGDWNDDGVESVALYDPDNVKIWFDWDDSRSWNPPSDFAASLTSGQWPSRPGDLAVSGIWFKRQRFWMADHGFRPNTTYMSSGPVLMMDSFLPFKKTRQTIPPELTHNVEPLWQRLKEYLNLNDFSWTYKDDWESSGLSREVAAAAFVCLALGIDCDIEGDLLDFKSSQQANKLIVEEEVPVQENFVPQYRASYLNPMVARRYVIAALGHDDSMLRELPLTY